jgi:superfamily II RNA helicase
MKENGQGVTFALQTIKQVYEKKYILADPSDSDPFLDTLDGNNRLVHEPNYSFEREGVDEATAVLDQAIDSLIPESNQERAREVMWECWNPAEFLQKTERDIENLRRSILDFTMQTVTESGKWLADLRLDRTLLVGEALNEKVFEKYTPAVVAGFMASLAADAERDYGELRLSVDLGKAIDDFKHCVFDVADVEIKFGVEPAEEVNFSAAAAAEAWADGMVWDELVSRTRAEEGDLVRLLSRTGEALMQIAHLRGEHELSAKKARETAEIVLREPIR